MTGGTAASNNLTLFSTSHATKGKLLFGTSAYDEVNNRLGINESSPTARIQVTENTTTAPTAILLRNNGGGAGTGAQIDFQRSTSVIGRIKTITGTSNVNNAMTFDVQGSTVMTLLGATGNAGIGVSPTAALHLKGGIATAGRARLKFTSGTSLTTAEAGAVEFTTDDLFFTITTGTGRKRFLFADPTGGLTSGRIPFATTNGRLTDDAGFTYSTSTGLAVASKGVFTGTLKTSDTLMTPNIISKAVDTTNYKPVVVDASGNHFKTNWAGGINYSVQSLTDGSTITWNVANGINGEVTLGGTGRTLSITNPVPGYTYKLRIIQDATGGRTITTWPTNSKWPNGTFPSLSSTGTRYDIVSFYYDGTNYYETFQQNFLTGAVANVSISSYDTKTSGSAATVHSLTGVPAGALLVLTTTMNSSSILDCGVSSSPSLTWTKRADAGATDSDNSEIWTAVYSGGGSISVTSNWGSNSQASVCYVVLDAESSLGGNSGTATLQSAPSVTISTTRANSIIFGCTGDWNTIDGTTRTFRDGATETLYFRNVDYTTYFYYKAATTTGSYTEGVSAPTWQQAATVILEIRGN